MKFIVLVCLVPTNFVFFPLSLKSWFCLELTWKVCIEWTRQKQKPLNFAAYITTHWCFVKWKMWIKCKSFSLKTTVWFLMPHMLMARIRLNLLIAWDIFVSVVLWLICEIKNSFGKQLFNRIKIQNNFFLEISCILDQIRITFNFNLKNHHQMEDHSTFELIFFSLSLSSFS